MKIGCVVMCIIVLLSIGTVVKLNHDYNVSLVNKYQLVKTNAHTIAIYSPEPMSNPIVPPKITKVAVVDFYIIGETIPDPSSDVVVLRTKQEIIYGYFIINTRDKKSELGIPKDAFWRKIRKMGYDPDDIILRRPSIMKYINDG